MRGMIWSAEWTSSAAKRIFRETVIAEMTHGGIGMERERRHRASLNHAVYFTCSVGSPMTWNISM